VREASREADLVGRHGLHNALDRDRSAETIDAVLLANSEEDTDEDSSA
jgi:hypothetical protein